MYQNIDLALPVSVKGIIKNKSGVISLNYKADYRENNIYCAGKKWFVLYRRSGGDTDADSGWRKNAVYSFEIYIIIFSRAKIWKIKVDKERIDSYFVWLRYIDERCCKTACLLVFFWRRIFLGYFFFT